MPNPAGRCPCYGCLAPRRNPGCHSYCDNYLEWDERNKKYREKARKEQEVSTMLHVFKQDGVIKAMRKNSSIKRKNAHR